MLCRIACHCLILVLLFTVCGESQAIEPKWGQLEGQFLFDDAPPQQRASPVPGGAAPIDESLVVDPKTHGVANVVLWLHKTNVQQLKIHPSFKESADAGIDLKLKGRRFEPHIVLLRTTQSVVIDNQHPFGHAIAFQSMNRQVSFLLPTDSVKYHKFDQPEGLPIKLTDNIHPWMNGWLLVQDHPYAAISDTSGKFSIPHLPVGQWQFRIWHERNGYVENATIGGRKVRWPKGLATFTIVEGTNNQGSINLDL